MRKSFVIAVVMTASFGAASADMIVVPPEAGISLAVTVYGDGLAFVRDAREVAMPSGASEIGFAAISAEILANSTWLETGLGSRVLSLNTNFDVLTPDAVLKRAVGKPVLVLRTHPQTGEETAEPATLLAAEAGVLIRRRDRVETVPASRIAFASLPDGLAAARTLSASVETTSPGRQTLTLSYLTGGLGWSADYLLTLDERTGRIGLTCRASIVNTSGTAYQRASVGLIAGRITRVSPAPAPQPKGRIEAMAAPSADAPVAERESVADLHLYRFAQPMTLEDRQTRQVTLFEVGELPVMRSYVSESGVSWQPMRGLEPQPSHPKVRLTFHAPAAQAAQPMPAGVVRVFARDGKGALRLMGEETMPPTPAGGRIELEPAEAFDISVLRRQTDFLTGREPNAFSEAAWQIVVENAKDEPVDVRLVERLPGDWKVLSQSAPYEKVSADRIAWTVTAPARGRAEVAYRVRTQR